MASPDVREQVDRVSNLRHDVTNPLTVILGYARMLANRKDLPPDVVRYAGCILDEARRCIDIFEKDKAAHESSPGLNGAAPAKSPGPSSDSRAAAILVVDDDSGIRSLSVEVIDWGLKESGNYDKITVESADTVAGALAIMRAHPLDAVVIDLNIGRPGGGLDLADQLEQVSPGMSSRVVFVSGGILDNATEARLDGMQVTMLHKPFSIHELVRAVMRALSI